MKWLRIGAACLTLSTASYAWAGPLEDRLGQPLDGRGKAPASASSGVMGIGDAAARSSGGAKSFGRALAGVQPEGRNATRGANETRVYRAASPAVVLIVTEDAIGSGVLISQDGRIVTNLHVIDGAKQVGVIFKPPMEGAAATDADVHRAKVLRRDEVTDLALIQVSEVPGHVKPLIIAKTAGVQVGADVHAIGHPTGEAWTYTRGIVSQIRRDYDWSTEDRLKHRATVIQTQTPINPGNSGGPLLDDQLQVIGINSFKGEGEGLNFAVSAEDVSAFLARTEDRVAETAGPPSDCRSKALSEARSEDGDATEYEIDADCDGKPDYVSIVPDNKREPTSGLYDDDGDGRLDSALFDFDRDGRPDRGLYDTDANGKFDMEGRFRKGEDEPYRYDRIKEER